MENPRKETITKLIADKLASGWNSNIDPKLAFIRSRLINNKDFSIICNNCWGGYVYRRYGMSYLTPTVGLYFWADDFVKFCKNLRYYLQECTLVFISYRDSVHRDYYERAGCQDRPIARLGDVEICFLHYENEEEARRKWETRAKCVNYNNLIFKFSEMNECSEEDIEEFDSLRADKKILFVSEKYNHYSSAVVIQKDGPVLDDTSHYARFINIEKLINSSSCCGKEFAGSYRDRSTRRGLPK